MRAAILTELNKDFEVRDDVELEGPGPGEVRVRLVASGVCHSDISFQNGTIPIPLPSVVGHEGAGEVIAVGDGVDSIAVGDHIIISWVPPCGACFFCLEHQPNLCMTGPRCREARQEVLGQAQGDPRLPGRVALHGQRGAR